MEMSLEFDSNPSEQNRLTFGNGVDPSSALDPSSSMERSHSLANNELAAHASTDGPNSGSAFSSQVWKGFEEKHSLLPARDKELVNQTADFPCRDFSMGEGDDDTLGKRHSNHNGGLYGSDRYIDDEENEGGQGDGGANRESTFDFFEETVLSNSPMENDGVDEFDD